jgi:hypothetical protein
MIKYIIIFKYKKIDFEYVDNPEPRRK